MASMSTIYGPGSVTTQTSAPTSGPLGGGPSATPDSSLFAKLAAAALEAKRRKAEEEAARQREQDRMARELHERQVRAIDEDRMNQISDRMRARPAVDTRGSSKQPEKYINYINPLRYGGGTVREINPAWEQWAAEHGQLEVGPDSVNIAPSVTPGASASQPFATQLESQAARGPAEDERADFLGTGTTNRKAQAATLLANAQARSEEAAVEDYLRGAGFGG